MSDGRPAANDQDRLPWLEPYREPPTRRARPVKAAKAPSPGGARGGLLAVAAVIGISAALAGGYWIGQRNDGGSEPVAVAPVATAPAQVALAEPVAPQPVVSEAEKAASAEAAAPTRRVAAKTARKKKGQRRAKIHSAGVETAAIDKVREQQGEPPPPRVWPRQPSPGPAGQVVQLGAYSHPDVAYAAYRRRLARYPGLARMPRVIVPVVRPGGDFLYVLRLGTGSRSKARTVCRNLRRSGDPCVVIG